jgi:hypothetical protein
VIQKGPAIGRIEYAVVEPVAELSLRGDLLTDDDLSGLLRVPEHTPYGEGDPARLGGGKKAKMDWSP